MRIHSRLLLGMFGLAVAGQSLAVAAPFGDEGAPAAVAGQPDAQAQPHHHHGLLGRRHCVECQRAYVKAHDGIDVPAPPPLEAGAMVHSHAMMAPGGSCPTCQGNAVASGPMLTADAHAPGYAVVGGGEMVASAGAPGYAVVNDAPIGQDPAPIGVSRSAQGGYGDPRMAAMGARPSGSYDPSVMPTSIPPAQQAIEGPGHNRPHIISHLLGLPKLGTIRRAREDKEREKHASIAYGEQNTKVTELSTEMVYGKNGH
jgi:hypothetical protein